MRISLVHLPWLVLGLLACIPGWSAAQQEKAEPPPSTLLPSSRIDLAWEGVLEKVTEASKAGDWDGTTKVLQQCFDAPPGALALVTVKGPDGKETK
jgi:hypothetical protein